MNATKPQAKKPQPTQKTRHPQRAWHYFLTSFLLVVLLLNFIHNPLAFVLYIWHIPRMVYQWGVDFGVTPGNIVAFFENTFWLIIIVIVAAILFIGPLVWYLNWEHRSQLRELTKPLKQYKEWDDPDNNQDNQPPQNTNKIPHKPPNPRLFW